MRSTEPQVSNQSKAASRLTDPPTESASLKETRDPSETSGVRREFTETYSSARLYGAILFAVLIIFLSGGLCVKAQTSASPPQPAPSPQSGGGRTSGDSRTVATPNSREVEDAFNELRALEIPVTDGSSRRSIIELTRNIYRKPNKTEMKVLTPSLDYLNKYALFLREPDTGIIKLNSDSSCTEESAAVIAAKENCLQYSMPGAGTAYSFREESHRIPRLADLTLSKNVLKSDGILQEGIMVKLGDIPLEEVTLQTKGLKYLVDFEPLTDLESLAKFDPQLLKGIKADGFVYSVGFYVRNQATYALRSIAYKGKIMRSVKGIAYNELDFDRRRDILVVFRVVEMEANGNITLIWKILSSKDAPTLKIKQVKDKNSGN